MSRDLSHIRRAVCYIRKSREDEEAEQRGEDTLAKQRIMLESEVLCKYPFPYDLAQEVASGDSIAARPVFRSLLPRLGRDYQAIVCKDLSRLGRGSYSDMGVVYDTIRRHRVFVITKDAVYDPANFSDLRMIRFALFFHREEYEMTLWRLTEGKYEGAARGRWVAGPAPYGYRYDRSTQTLVPADTADTVRAVFAWRGEGLSYRAIAQRLTALGEPTPGGGSGWRSETVRRILCNPVYKGTLLFRKTRRDKSAGRVITRPRAEHIVVPHAFTPLVEEDVWDRAQPGEQRLPTRSARPVAELAGIVHCGGCGQRMVRQSGRRHYRRRDGHIAVYAREFLYCPRCRYAIKYRDCEQQLLEVLRRILINPADLAAAWRRTGAAGPRSASVAQGLTPRAGTTWNERLRRARRYLLEGILSADEYQEVKAECEAALKALEAWQSELPSAVATGDLPPPPVCTLLDVYQALTRRDWRNSLLKTVFAKVVVERVARGTKGHPTLVDLRVELGVTCDIQPS